MSFAGWFAPWWPKRSLRTVPPSASPRIWWPRQMPKVGFFSISLRTVGGAYFTSRGSAGPLERKMPSGWSASAASAVVCAGTTVTSKPALTSSRRMLRLIP